MPNNKLFKNLKNVATFYGNGLIDVRVCCTVIGSMQIFQSRYMTAQSVRQSISSVGRGNRYIALDVARGIAALVVVLWHWQHFWFGADGLRAGFVRSAQPFYDELR